MTEKAVISGGNAARCFFLQTKLNIAALGNQAAIACHPYLFLTKPIRVAWPLSGGEFDAFLNEKEKNLAENFCKRIQITTKRRFKRYPSD